MKRIFIPQALSSRASLGLLFLRLFAGVAMMHHGWGKIQNPFAWMGPTAPVPGFLQGLAALSEFGGGLALILGLLTPLAMLGLLCTMAFAATFHISKGDPLVAKGGGASWELAGLYLVIALCFILVGPGRFSLDSKLFRSSASRA
ncbi:DoxX family protein [Pyxidicoccus fallax]|uniref:DoxX family protein n=1 Tax=Pyxidicoccus fallax TaxID=394095 RepID=A0A848LL12_9BACT|nr:DoxX family protein [Pyxidicoccus fallax]NMO18334.1 DoxX family protein [Pyxidicoccus fallax]NPC85264.1 DoxX family protein [Pyxidicoccus fallax]